MKIVAKMAVPVRYPRFIDMVTASPAVSPRVVAAILMIQNRKVTFGTLCWLASCFIDLQYRVLVNANESVPSGPRAAAVAARGIAGTAERGCRVRSAGRAGLSKRWQPR